MRVFVRRYSGSVYRSFVPVEQIHKLTKSYLSSRTFVIKIKDTYPEIKAGYRKEAS